MKKCLAALNIGSRLRAMNGRSILLYLLLLLPRLLLAQIGPSVPTPKSNVNIIPPSPEAANLGKYGDIPIGYYTGSISTSIPISEIKSGKISVPVSLDYNSGGGVKVSEVANNIGLGWSLSAANVVTRAVASKADDVAGGFLSTITSYTPQFLDPFSNYTAPQANAHLKDLYKIANSCIDFQPDIFYYNFAGYSGKFFFDWNGQIVNESSSPIKITYLTGSMGIKQWSITTPEGLQYTFATTEETISQNPLAEQNGICNSSTQDFTSSWYLTKIMDTDSNMVSFSYEPYSYKMFNTTSHSVTVNMDNQLSLFNEIIGGYSECPSSGQTRNDVFHLGIVNNGPQYASQLLQYFQLRLKTITSSDGGQITFNYQTDRQDVAGLLSVSQFKMVDNIKLSSSGVELKTWSLNHDYSSGRLTLKGVTETGVQGQPDKSYKMNYSGGIPSITSFGVDHWGYCNGREDNPSLVPSFVTLLPDMTGSNIPGGIAQIYHGADREVDTLACLSGLLTKITYPTGGYSEFVYEAHETGKVQNKNIVDFKLHPRHWMYKAAIADGIPPGTIEQTNVDTFHVNQTTNVLFNYSAYIDNVQSLDHMPEMFIKQKQGNSFVTIKTKQYNFTTAGTTTTPGNQFESETIQLTPGIYTITAKATRYNILSNTPEQANISAIYEFVDTTINLEKIPVGGARIKTINNFDPYSGVVNSKKISYIVPDTPSATSGVIYSLPDYVYSTDVSTDVICHFDDQGGVVGTDAPNNVPFTYTVQQEVHSAHNNYQLGSTSGSHIGYEWVTVTEQGNGKKEFHFTSPALYSDFIDDVYPFMPPSFSKAYKTGLLVDEKNYASSGSNYILKQAKKNVYDFSETSVRAYGVSFRGSNDLMELFATEVLGDASKYPPRAALFEIDNFDMTSGYAKTISETETNYFPGPVTTTVSKTYHPVVKQLIQTESTVNSDGKQTTQKYTYPVDEQASPVISAMINKNMVGIPLATKTFVNNNLSATEKKTYGLFNANKIALQKLETSTYSAPLETEITYDSYDNKGHLLSYTSRGNIKGAVLWGYNNSYPVVELKHIDVAALNAFMISNSNIQSTLNNPPTDQALRNAIQQIRANFPNAMITGYTYKPLVGMTSQTDVNNRVTFYEYDTMGRLARVKDKDGNILKQNSYQYQVTE
jgi:hypothetical protein